MKKISIIISCVYVVMICLQIYAAVQYDAARTSVLPENFGNFERVRERLSESDQEKPFTFVAMGDTRTSATFEELAEDITKSNPAFIVFLGDWVRKGSVGWHAYFREECREYNFSCPVFFVPGNHDVDPETYSLANYETAYGPRNFSFVYKNNFFIFISHLDSRFSNRDSMEYLRSLNDTKLGTYARRFVFMHIPPWVSTDVPERHTADEKELVQILQEMRIDYVMAADFHGYNRTRRNGIEYIITGGGGSRLHETTGPQFHHAIALSVSPDMLSERIIPASVRFDLEDWAEMHAAVNIGPVMFRNPSYFVLGNVLLLIVLVVLNRISRKTRF